MNTALWTIAGVLAFAFAAAGLLKLTRSKTTLAVTGMGLVYNSPLIAVNVVLAALALCVVCGRFGSYSF
ncbi:hypothetical protein R4282_11795 [Rhodococcus oxybenzonivorans]|uniref:hypothetical protein n=1 Tax=Rhodococcus oxybenzonivorans TaxID=1990687 RepID=UPI0029531997|nr:hypothetical protein [Rhodococcus oxybenzonivorans]MDV7353689.1 hypothetical protein [Rhodococcus oxybenzonivorans]